MKQNTLLRTGGIAATVLTLSLGLAACGSSDSDGSAASDTASSAAPSETPASDAPTSEAPATTDASADTFGPGCAAIPTSGKGSFNGMVQDPVATAASNNPLLKTLVTAVGVAGLGDTLNSAEALTVFAPTDDAFKKIPEADLNKVLADKATLTAILTHHVIAGELDQQGIVGKHETLNKDMLTVKGSGDNLTVAGDNAKILCGNIPTANAKVYVIDTVLMPS